MLLSLCLCLFFACVAGLPSITRELRVGGDAQNVLTPPDKWLITHPPGQLNKKAIIVV